MSRMTPARHLAGSAPRCKIKASQTAPGPGHGWVPKPCGNEWRENWKNKGRSELLPGAHGRLPMRQVLARTDLACGQAGAHGCQARAAWSSPAVPGCAICGTWLDRRRPGQRRLGTALTVQPASEAPGSKGSPPTGDACSPAQVLVLCSLSAV